MDTDAFLADVREANETALSRLGSSKSLYALTGGEMEAEAVLGVAADVSHAAATSLEAYAMDASSDAAAEAVRDLGDLEAQRAMTLAGDDSPTPHDVVAALEEYGDGAGASDAERLGAALGYVLVSKKFAEQCTGFFTGEADPGTASDFRSYGNDLESQREAVLAALASVSSDDDDRSAAADAASTVVQHAYEYYTDRLEDMGVNPKPVC